MIAKKSEVLFRFLKMQDKVYWQSLWQQYLEFYRTPYKEEVANSTFKRLISTDENIGCVVACDEQDIPIAFLTFIVHLSTWHVNPVCYLEDLFVATLYRRKGIARNLIENLQIIAKQKNFSKIYWLTEPENVAGIALYNQLAKGSSWIQYSLKF